MRRRQPRAQKMAGAEGAMRTAWIPGIGLVTLATALLGCSSPPQGVFEDPKAPLSRVRYVERDLVSLNDSCPVTGTRLNPAIPPVYTNGRPIGFC